MKKYKNYLICFTIVIIILVITIVKEEDNASSMALEAFSINEVKLLDNKVTLSFEKCQNATHYLVTVTDKDNNILFREDTKENTISLQSVHAEYEEDVIVTVTAFNEREEQRKSNNTYTYKWQNPSFDDENNSNIVTENRDFFIKVLGDMSKGYNLKILYKNNSIYKTKLDTTFLLISYNVLKDYKGKLTAVITDDEDNILHEMNFYNNPIIVSNVSIIYPSINQDVPFDNLNLTFEGGENATTYKVNIYKGKRKIKTVEGSKGLITIPAKNLEENTTYKLELLATYKDYDEIAKRAEVTINVGEKKQVAPVYTNYNPEAIKSGTYVSLLSRTTNATIKYTTDGTSPLKKGQVYKEPIKLTDNMKIKAIAIKEGLENSDITSFDFKINEKIPIIYLSPSKQEKNVGVNEVGYTTEAEMMNKLCNILENKLKQSGFIVYRNNPKKDMMEWLSESRKVHADLHLAIHSNGSTNHDTKGMEIYVDDFDSEMLSLASIIYTNLYDIYPYKGNATDRGIKYALGSLGEVKKVNTSKGILLEIAHHDDVEDAKWMVDNLEQISNNIANSIISYYGLG